MKQGLRISKQLTHLWVILILISVLSLSCGSTTYYRLYNENDATDALTLLTNKHCIYMKNAFSKAIVIEVDGNKIFSGGAKDVEGLWQVVELAPGSHTIVATICFWTREEDSKAWTIYWNLSEHGRKFELVLKPQTEYEIMTWGHPPVHGLYGFMFPTHWDTDYDMWIQEKETGHIVAGQKPIRK